MKPDGRSLDVAGNLVSDGEKEKMGVGMECVGKAGLEETTEG
jgi:hypothetical protein